jgi:glycosyltransferase involved in cell wall biosynthesis
MKKISVIIPFAGNDPERTRNLEECLGAIFSQNYKNYEVILVEQTLNGAFYQHDRGGRIKHITISDPQNRGFNLSWCRNVGAKEATGDTLILMDSDFVFDAGYFDRVAAFEGEFAAGSETYYWCNTEEPTREWLRTKDFNVFERFGSEPKDSVFVFRSMTRGCGYGAIIVFSRKWYWEVFGGYIENFFKYGWEDKASFETIKVLLNRSDEEMSRIPGKCYHLSHRGKDIRNMNINERLYETYRRTDQKEIAERQRSLDLGKKEGPVLI